MLEESGALSVTDSGSSKVSGCNGAHANVTTQQWWENTAFSDAQHTNEPCIVRLVTPDLRSALVRGGHRTCFTRGGSWVKSDDVVLAERLSAGKPSHDI